MNFIKTEIEGVILIEPRLFRDSRGLFFESYRQDEFEKNGIENCFVQDNQSLSVYGTVRGLHRQKEGHEQAKLVRVLHGEILDVVIDIRRESPTFGKLLTFELSDRNGYQLFVPRGFLHGFSVLSDTAVCLYKVDDFYCKDAEYSVYPLDKDLGIDWKIPKDKIIISDKDRLGNSFKDVVDNRR